MKREEVHPDSKSFYAMLDDRDQYKVLLKSAMKELGSIEPDERGRFLQWQLDRKKKIGNMILECNQGLKSIKIKLRERNSLAVRVSKKSSVRAFIEIVRQNVDYETWNKIHKEYRFRSTETDST